MTFVITEPCIDIKDGTCISVCPVDCIHPTPDEPDFVKADQLYIDPGVCIDCNVCVDVCPVDAIYEEHEVPEKWQSYVEVNERYYEPTARS
jgi:ferredoxin